MSGAACNFLLLCRPGMTLQTRDRHLLIVTRIDRGVGLIHGSVEGIGDCRWGADGRLAGAPCGAAGPLDLRAPEEAAPRAPQHRVTLAEALDPANRAACCD